VNISFYLLWALKIHHSLYVFHIDSSCCNVSGHQHLRLSFEAVHDDCSFILIFISMQNQRGNSQSIFDELSYFFACFSLVSKNKDLSLNQKFMKMSDHPLKLFVSHLNNHHILHHILVCCSFLPDIDPDWSRDNIVDEKLCLFLHGCCEE